MAELITIGEPLVVFASQQPNLSLADATHFKKGIGGAELNVAIGAERLGHSVDYISRVGTEPLGQYIVKEISEFGIGTNYISKDDYYLTGHQFKQRVTHGDPEVANYRQNSAASHLTGDQIQQINLDGVKIAHLTGIFPAISKTAQQTFKLLLNRLIANHILITFDTNLRPALWDSRSDMIKTINNLAGYADIVLPGLNEGKTLIGSDNPEKIADFYLKNGRTKAVIIKIGPKGSFIKMKSGKQAFISGFRVNKVVDTVGAGDGFALGVITGLLEGKSPQEAALRGNAIGALQVQTPGDNDGYPDRRQLKAFYKKAGISKESGVAKFVREI